MRLWRTYLIDKYCSECSLGVIANLVKELGYLANARLGGQVVLYDKSVTKVSSFGYAVPGVRRRALDYRGLL